MSFFAFLHNFRLAFRNKSLTCINIFGLGVGLTVVMFLLTYLQFEFSFDKHFKDADRIYRMLSVWEEEGVEVYPICLQGLGPALAREIPEVEMSARIYPGSMNYIRHGNDDKLKTRIYEVDSTFLRIFDFKPVFGQLENALDLPGRCVISRTLAERIFGKEVNPVGEILIAGHSGPTYEIAAVMEDVPVNTHFKFGMLVRFPDKKFPGLEFYTYLKFREGVKIPEAIEKCNNLNNRLLEERFGDNSKAVFRSITEPLTSVHTATRADYDLSLTMDKVNLFFIVLVTLFILGIAVSNYIALYIIQGEERALEISIRKTNGGTRMDIVRMLFAETFLITFLAFLVAGGLYFGFLDTVLYILNFSILELSGLSLTVWLEFFILFVIVACIAGIYPAFYLSRFGPGELIRRSKVRRYRLTATSVIVQFSVVLFCITALLVVFKQLDYIRKIPLGFQSENIMVVDETIYLSEYEGLRSELLQSPFILQVAVAQGNPLRGGSGMGIRRYDQEPQEAISVDERRVGPEYFELYEIPLIEGKYFSDYGKPAMNEVILSASTVSALGLKDAVGRKVWIWEDEPSLVIGVVKDLVQSAHYGTGNWMYSANTKRFYTLAVKFVPDKFAEARSALRKVLDSRFKGNKAVISLFSRDVQLEYQQEQIASQILMGGTILAILLTLSGLLALSGFVARQKRKEISVRRALGAQIHEIVLGLNVYIIKRTLPALPIGVLLGYFVMWQWLGSFHYATQLSWWIFALAILITLVIILLATLYQSIKAATENPVKALKSE